MIAFQDAQEIFLRGKLVNVKRINNPKLSNHTEQMAAAGTTMDDLRLPSASSATAYVWKWRTA
uniref:Uncharacterized protein n=1 Tax=Romanomermis culicivorax TaxID=13658 RepID=A0A915IAN3_ROMCU